MVYSKPSQTLADYVADMSPTRVNVGRFAQNCVSAATRHVKKDAPTHSFCVSFCRHHTKSGLKSTKRNTAATAGAAAVTTAATTATEAAMTAARAVAAEGCPWCLVCAGNRISQLRCSPASA